MSMAYSAPAKKVRVLPAQTINVAPSHLTTRLQWVKFPQPKYSNADLHEQPRAAIIRVIADEQGHVKQASVEESTGFERLDLMLIHAVEQAQVKPHLQDGQAVEQIGYQAFNLKLHRTGQACRYHFNSKIWQAQQDGKNTPFQYAAQPELDLTDDTLNGHSRKVKFSFNADKHGYVKKVKIKQGSGLYALDQHVVQAVKASRISVKRTASTLWLYKKSSFKDELQFNLDECQ